MFFSQKCNFVLLLLVKRKIKIKGRVATLNQILYGKPVAEKIKQNVAGEISSGSLKPILALIRVGDRPDDVSFAKSITKNCENLGIGVLDYHLAEDGTETELLPTTIIDCNEDENVSAIMLLRPLPKHLNEKKIVNLINPLKDVDGITVFSQAMVYGDSCDGFAPCTAQSCMEILDFYNIDLTGKNVVVLGRSLVVGKPLAMMLLKKNATVTICHSKTKNLQEICKAADIVIVAIGKAKFLTSDYVRDGQIVLDVGINLDENGKLCGDVDFEGIKDIVASATPVPGGVGPVTSALICQHIIQAHKKGMTSKC